MKKGPPEYKFDPRFDWWTKDHLRNYRKIQNLFEGQDNLCFLEIGIFEGRSTIWFLENVLTGENCHYICLDPDPTKNMRHNFREYNRCSTLKKSPIKFHKRHSEEFLPELIAARCRYFDFIYLDGDHNAQGVLRDAVYAWELLKVGGVLLFDDYEMQATDPWHYVSHSEFSKYPRVNFTHPRIAVDAFLNIYRGTYKIIVNNFQVGIQKITDIGEKNVLHGDDEQPEDFTYIEKR